MIGLVQDSYETEALEKSKKEWLLQRYESYLTLVKEGAVNEGEGRGLLASLLPYFNNDISRLNEHIEDRRKRKELLSHLRELEQRVLMEQREEEREHEAIVELVV